MKVESDVIARKRLLELMLMNVLLLLGHHVLYIEYSHVRDRPISQGSQKETHRRASTLPLRGLSRLVYSAEEHRLP